MTAKKQSKAGRKTRAQNGLPPREALTLKVEPETAKAFRELCSREEKSQVVKFTEMVAKEVER